MKGYAPRRGFYIGLGHDEEVLTFFIIDGSYVIFIAILAFSFLYNHKMNALHDPFLD